MRVLQNISTIGALLLLAILFSLILPAVRADEPKKGETKELDLGGEVGLTLVYLPSGKFMMGSTAAEKLWATGIEGGAQPGTARETYEGEARLMQMKNGFWMGRTEVSMGQFRRFVEETQYVTDAEKPGGETQVLDLEWVDYNLPGEVINPWKSMAGKSWRDPNFGIPMMDSYPVVCVSYNDMKAFCTWLTEKESKAGRLPEGMEYRLPTEAEWAYGCRGGSEGSHHFWWGDSLKDGEGRLNISAVDFLPGRSTMVKRAATGLALRTCAVGCGSLSWIILILREGMRRLATRMRRSFPFLALCAVAGTTSMCRATPVVRCGSGSRTSAIPTRAMASGSAWVYRGKPRLWSEGLGIVSFSLGTNPLTLTSILVVRSVVRRSVCKSHPKIDPCIFKNGIAFLCLFSGSLSSPF